MLPELSLHLLEQLKDSVTDVYQPTPVDKVSPFISVEV